MPKCSLCGNPMPDEGGAVLFADSHGVPFEVCGECETRFDTLRTAADDAEAKQAADYIFEQAESRDRSSDVYEALMSYTESCRVQASPDGAEAEHGGAPGEGTAFAADATPDQNEAEASDAVDADHAGGMPGKRGWATSGVLIAVIAALLLLAWALSGFRLF